MAAGVRDYKVPHPIPLAGAAVRSCDSDYSRSTGSEVTRFTVVSDSESGEKMLIAGGVRWSGR